SAPWAPHSAPCAPHSAPCAPHSAPWAPHSAPGAPHSAPGGSTLRPLGSTLRPLCSTLRPLGAPHSNPWQKQTPHSSQPLHLPGNTNICKGDACLWAEPQSHGVKLTTSYLHKDMSEPFIIKKSRANPPLQLQNKSTCFSSKV
uniref:Uncharacterized protein n=1 Tax=Neogobius melanostomus TaxID=47308 RepID=A0A8C6TBS4_9GOBI